MIAKTIFHYKPPEKLGEARLLRTCLVKMLEVLNG